MRSIALLCDDSIQLKVQDDSIQLKVQDDSIQLKVQDDKYMQMKCI